MASQGNIVESLFKFARLATPCKIAKECKQLDTLQKCVVTALEKCDAPTTGNIVESLFKFARQATPCKIAPAPTEAKPRSQVQGDTKGSAAAATVSFALMLLTVAAAIL
ncbi:hypothetical protein NE865_10876 [Phthorimaea operculella]|nr:hypothetical protein NE865_10876 [Phthorimaea operculella]